MSGGVQGEGGFGAVRGTSTQSSGCKEITANGRQVTGVEGDFGFQHKGKRGGVTVEGKGREGEGCGGEAVGWGVMNQLACLLLCKCY